MDTLRNRPQPRFFIHSLLMTTATIASISPSFADTFFGVYVGAGLWQNQFSGTFAETGNPIDLESDLGFDDESNNFVYAAIEHPLPIIPNIRLSQTEIESTANSTLNQDIVFIDTTYSFSAEVNSLVDLTFSDVTFYYELLDNAVSLDLGLTGRNFDGEIRISSGPDSEIEDLSETIPMLYGKAAFELPLTGLYVSGSFNGIGLDDNNITDISISVGYESMLGLGAELGYRRINIEIEDISDLTTDIDIDGMYLATTFHF